MRAASTPIYWVAKRISLRNLAIDEELDGSSCGGDVIPEATETLAIAFDPPSECSRKEDPDATALRGADPGVHALAHEMRRVLLTEGEQAQTYLARLADTLITRALLVSGVQPAQRRRPDLAPFNLRRVAEHIDSRLTERIAVEDLASVAGFSQGYFSRAFLAATGEPPHQFILTRRLAEA